eukprot:SAG25_NODE_8930_length_396_cov_1.087542_1_plen_65_part_10
MGFQYLMRVSEAALFWREKRCRDIKSVHGTRSHHHWVFVRAGELRLVVYEKGVLDHRPPPMKKFY